MKSTRYRWALTSAMTLIAAFGAHLGGTAQAQGCPAGMPHVPGCIPPHLWPQNQAGPAAPTAPAQPPPPRDFSLKAFGAFAYDPQTGAIGHSNDPRWQLDSQQGGIASVEHISKRSAERAALDRCAEKGGGKSCRIVANYRNECAAFMIGTGTAGSVATPGGNLSGGRPHVGRGATKLDAQRASQTLCAAQSASCAPAWADCVKDFSTQD